MVDCNMNVIEVYKDLTHAYVHQESMNRFKSIGLFGTEFSMENYLLADQMRKMFIVDYGFIIYDNEYTEALSEYLKGKRVLEVCAGNGYLTYHLRKAGVKIKAVDNYSRRYGINGIPFRNKLGVVEVMDAMDAIKKYNPDVVLASWIDFGSTLDMDIYEWSKSNKREFICIGELGGCTGSEEFSLMPYVDGYDVLGVDIYQFDGIHDYTYIFGGF